MTFREFQFRSVLFVCLALFVDGTARGARQTNEAQAHSDKGLAFARAGDLESAEAELRRAVELNPSDAQTWTSLGTVLAMEKKLEESTTDFARALNLDSGNLIAQRYLAANLWQLHRYPEAKQNLITILRKQPGDRQSLLLLGMVSENMKDYPAAVKSLSAVPELVRERPESIASLARSYYHVGQEDKARATLMEFQANTSGPQGVLLGIHIADEAGDYTMAEKLLLAAESSGAEPPATLAYELALVQYHAERFDDSLRTLQEQIDSGHPTSQIYNLLGWCYEKQNQGQQAVHALQQSVALAPTEESNYLDLGEILVANGSLAAALELARRTVQAFPESSRALLLKGSVESKLTQFTDAVESYSRASQLSPAVADCALGLAIAESAAGMTDRAAATFDAGIKEFPKDGRFDLEYAIMLLKQSETGNASAKQRAEHLLESALAIDPSLAEAHYQLGNLDFENERVSAAISQFQAAVKLAPASAKSHFALSRAYRRMGRKEAADKEMSLYEELNSKESLRATQHSPTGIAPR